MNNPSKIHCFVDSFSIFKRSIAISGWAFCPDAIITEMLLRFPNGSIYVLSKPNLPSDDVAAVYGESALQCRFDAQVIVHEPHQDFLKAELLIRTNNGIERSLFPIHNLANNPVNQVRDRFQALLKNAKSDGHLLEIGSRARSGIVRRELTPNNWLYTGVDVMAGENVDVVGDAHQLSRLFPDQRFDAVTAFSVLEHLLMPWKFVVELNQVLNVGAIGLFATHQSWPLHDAPWDFWRFSDKAWTALFNRATGFEIIATAMGEPAYTVATFCHSVTDFQDQPSYLASVVLFRKVSDTALTWPVEVDEITDSHYPTTTATVGV